MVDMAYTANQDGRRLRNRAQSDQTNRPSNRYYSYCTSG